MRTLPLLVIMAVVGLSARAHAAGWVSSGPLTPPDRTAVDAHVALTPSGERVVAWIQFDATGQQPENISVRVAPPGGDFGPTQTFPDAPFDGLRLATGADGTIALAWTVGPHTLHIARRAPGATSFVDERLGVPGEEFIFSPSLAVTGGDAYVALSSFTGSGLITESSSVWVARLAAGSTDIRIVPGPAGAGNPIAHVTFTVPAPEVFLQGATLAADNGRVDVAWERDNEGAGTTNATTQVVNSTLGPGGPDGTFGTPLPLDSIASTTTTADRALPVAVAGAGHSYILWPRSRAGQVAFQDVANPGLVRTFPGIPDSFEGIRAGVDSRGSLIGALSGDIPPSFAAGATAFSAPVGAPIPTPVQLTPSGIDRTVDDVAVAPDGTALILSDRDTSFDSVAQVDAFFRPAGGTFGSPEAISGLVDTGFERDHAASAAVASGGRALVLWASADHTGTPNQRLRLSERDTSPPVFGDIAVPATATAGQAVALSAPATDALSGAATVHWDFGDGSQASGPSVSHVFANAGATTVTITTTDTTHNTATATRTITIAPAPVTTTTTTTKVTRGPDRTPPVVTRLALSHARFRVAPSATARFAVRRTAKHAAPAAGTSVSMSLSERATLVLAVTATVHGRSVTRGTLVRASAGPGAAKVAFSGRLGATALAPGSYRLTVTAIDGSGNRSKPVSTRFSIIKAPRR
jgi:hypothetical protein